MKDLEKKLKALANLRRLAILIFLKARQEANVQSISEHLDLSLKATSRHLKVLFLSGVVEKDQRNTNVYYRLTPNSLYTIKIFIDRL